MHLWTMRNIIVRVAKRRFYLLAYITKPFQFYSIPIHIHVQEWRMTNLRICQCRCSYNIYLWLSELAYIISLVNLLSRLLETSSSFRLLVSLCVHRTRARTSTHTECDKIDKCFFINSIINFKFFCGTFLWKNIVSSFPFFSIINIFIIKR